MLPGAEAVNPLALQVVSLQGLTPVYASATAAGDWFQPTARSFFHVKNSSGSPVTLTFITPREIISDVDYQDISVSVPAAGAQMIGPLPPRVFADPSNSNYAGVLYSATTGLTVAVVSLPL
jgi:hypothetical protein